MTTVPIKKIPFPVTFSYFSNTFFFQINNNYTIPFKLVASCKESAKAKGHIFWKWTKFFSFVKTVDRFLQVLNLLKRLYDVLLVVILCQALLVCWIFSSTKQKGNKREMYTSRRNFFFFQLKHYVTESLERWLEYL